MKRVITLLALAGLAGAAFIPTAFAAAEIGQPAPDFTATDIHGKTVKLSDYKGKIVVLESYNLECPFCANHFKSGAMQELQKDMTGKGVVWIMVNSVNPKHSNYKSPEKAQAEWNELKLNATVEVQDSDGKVGKLYGMKTTPHMFVINKDGVLVYNGAIDDKKDNSHDPRKARNYVREAVAKLRSEDHTSELQSRLHI